MKVKTKDWGSKFKDLSDHIGQVSNSIVQHNQSLAQEAGTHQHAFGRHGWQTGWEAQIVRAASGVTPDSSHDPYGLNPALRNWGSVFVSGPNGLQMERYGRGSQGQRVITGFGTENIPLPSHVPPNRGCSAGQFISPMAQQAAIQAVKTKMNAKYSKWVRGERKKGHTLTWHPARRMVIVTGTKKILGLGFEASSGGTPRSEAETKFLIDAFQRGRSIKDVVNNCPFANQTTRTATISAIMATHKISNRQSLSVYNDSTAFPQITDLCTCLNVTVAATKNVLSVWDWKTATSKWQLVTCYATNDPREEAEYTLVGTSKANGKVTGKLKAAGTTTKLGTIKQGKVIVS